MTNDQHPSVESWLLRLGETMRFPAALERKRLCDASYNGSGSDPPGREGTG